MFITLEHNSISQRLVSYRQQLGKSQAEMSREFGVNQSHYSKLESGTKYISYSSLKKFEKAVEAGDKAAAEVSYKEAVSKLDKAVAKGTLHINAAARKKGQFTVKLNAMK